MSETKWKKRCFPQLLGWSGVAYVCCSSSLHFFSLFVLHCAQQHERGRVIWLQRIQAAGAGRGGGS